MPPNTPPVKWPIFGAKRKLESRNNFEQIAKRSAIPNMSQPYIHIPFKGSCSIRVLFLEPESNYAAPLCCNLVELPLEPVPEYSALSYAWDVQHPSCPVQCNGGVLKVTPNCESALRRLRHGQDVQKLWIDSICIYSHRTTMKHLGTMRFVPQFFEGCDFTYLASQIWQYILPYFRLKSIGTPCQFFDLVSLPGCIRDATSAAISASE
jgi:hypothetical protein